MASDANLIKGAYDAAGSRTMQQWNHAKHQELMKIGKMVESWDFGTGAQRIIDSNGRLPQSEINAMRDELSGPMKDEFMNGDKKKQEEIQAQVVAMKEQRDLYKQMRQGLAMSVTSKELSQSFMNSPEGKDVLNLMRDGNPNLVKKTCPEGEDNCEDKGSLGVMMTDHKKISDTQQAMRNKEMEINNLEQMYDTGATYGDESDLDALYKELSLMQELVDSKPTTWKSLQQINGTVLKIDKSTINVLEAARNKTLEKAFNTLPEDDKPFNRDQAAQMINNTIVNKGNLQSMIYDEMIPGRSFYNDMIGNIQGGTYSQYGITDAQMEMADLNADGIIDKNEATHIGNEMLKNEEYAKEELSEYMVNYLQQNHNMGLKSRRETYIDKDESTLEEDTTQNVIDYVPQSQREDKEEEDVGDAIESNDVVA